MTMTAKCSREWQTSKSPRLAAIGVLLIAALAVASSTDAQSSALTLQYQQVVTRPVPGATAAFSLDTTRVGASAQDGLVTLVGRGPGLTNVVIVIGDRTESLQVVVGEPPVVSLPGMRSLRSSDTESGHYELRYGSDPGTFQGTLRFVRREGERSTELVLGGAAPLGGAATLGGPSASPFSIPLASYTIRTPQRELTVMDHVVKNSPLTVSQSNVRGLHLQQGPLRVHGGYSFFGNFEHLLLPTSKESMAGVGYRYQLSPRSSLTPNVYYFDGHRPGTIGTLLYEARSISDVKFAAEIGVSRAVGGAVEIDVDRPNRHAWAKLRFAPSELPSLATDQQPGRHIEAGWATHGDTISLNANVSSRSYPTPFTRSGTQAAFSQTSNVASFDVQRRLTSAWAIHGGPGYSVFNASAQSASKIHNVTLPLGTTFSRRNVGFGADYQFSRETTRNLAGHLFRANLNAGARGFRFSVNGERQTHAPTVRQIFTDAPWLQPMLDRLGLAAGTPQQLANLMRTNAELAGYGYANNLVIDISPVRSRVGLSAGWSGSGESAPQIFMSTLINRDQLVDRTTENALHSVNYSQRLGTATELFVTGSTLCSGSSLFSSCRPAVFASLRQSLTSAPGILARHRGTIQGAVFRDDEARGEYAPGAATVAGVEVILDGVRTTRTDGSGWFRFEDVPYGRHRVEARYVSGQPTFFTTPSPADVETGAFVHFGIGMTRSSIRGVIRTDAGDGLPGVVLRIAGADRQLSVSTTDNGTFVAEGLTSGSYTVAIDAGSVPAGYPVDSLEPQLVVVKDTQPGRATFVLRPYRSVSGRAKLFNRETGQYEPLAGATLELHPVRGNPSELGVSQQRRAVTDFNGLYTFRDLPSGDYTIVGHYNGQDRVVAVSVPAGPTFVRDLDVALVPTTDVAGGAKGMLARGVDQRAPSKPGGPPTSTRAGPGPGPGLGPGPGPGLGPSPGPGSAFTIHVTESSNVRHARAMVSELKQAGYAAYLVEPGPSARGGSYQVRVGHFATAADANRSARGLEKMLGWTLSVTTSPHLVGQTRAISYGG
jgi:hypothetical protein